MSDWCRTEVAPESTHHVLYGQPLYAERFDEVLKFHPPGLAAVRRGEQAWHIDVRGKAAYERRFERTFGFYEDRAAVVDGAGWRHIRPDGEDVYPERYGWCGNYQESKCAVREAAGRYLHLDLAGAPLYVERWRYAGDFKEGLAVVQADHGRSTHVDGAGRALHAAWFLDLDVFHKGYARARDEDGWTHVDRRGRPAYARRFAAVEPFYNGQARVERFDGGLELIDEHGVTVAELRPATRSEFASLSGDLVGFWRTQAAYAAVALGVVEALPETSQAVAARCALDPDRAARLLRALGEMKLVERRGEQWILTSKGAPLRREHPQTLSDAALEYARPMTELWSALPEAMRAGSRWAPPDIFGQVAADADRVAGHHRMLKSYATHDYEAIPAALPLKGDETVIDAGGGVGVLAELLVRHYPKLRVVLLDRPEVIRLAHAREEIIRRPANLFSPWRVTGDAVVLARVLHDWDDDRAVTVLRHARRALRPGGLIFIVEMVLSEQGMAGGLCDLHLLMATGGRERTVSQFADLLGAAEFDFKEVRRVAALPSVIIGAAR